MRLHTRLVSAALRWLRVVRHLSAVDLDANPTVMTHLRLRSLSHPFSWEMHSLRATLTQNPGRVEEAAAAEAAARAAEEERLIAAAAAAAEAALDDAPPPAPLPGAPAGDGGTPAPGTLPAPAADGVGAGPGAAAMAGVQESAGGPTSGAAGAAPMAVDGAAAGVGAPDALDAAVTDDDLKAAWLAERETLYKARGRSWQCRSG
jgi:hypothetical protein